MSIFARIGHAVALLGVEWRCGFEVTDVRWCSANGLPSNGLDVLVWSAALQISDAIQRNTPSDVCMLLQPISSAEADRRLAVLGTGNTPQDRVLPCRRIICERTSAHPCPHSPLSRCDHHDSVGVLLPTRPMVSPAFIARGTNDDADVHELVSIATETTHRPVNNHQREPALMAGLEPRRRPRRPRRELQPRQCITAAATLLRRRILL